MKKISKKISNTNFPALKNLYEDGLINADEYEAGLETLKIGALAFRSYGIHTIIGTNAKAINKQPGKDLDSYSDRNVELLWRWILSMLKQKSERMDLKSMLLWFLTNESNKNIFNGVEVKCLFEILAQLWDLFRSNVKTLKF